MCATNFDAREPHKKLAELLSRELGVTVNAAALRLCLKHHWSKISPLAHAVHDEAD